MPHYLALTYTEDVDWTAPEQADTLTEYRQFGEQKRSHGGVIASRLSRSA